MSVLKKHQRVSTSNYNVYYIILLIALLLGGDAFAATAEVEPNDDAATAQNLNGAFGLNPDPDIGDKTTNTSTQIPHQTIIGKGHGPTSKDIYKFSVKEAGKAIFDIDYGDFNFNPDRFGIAVQFDGTIWIKDDKDFYFLDEQMRPHWGFRTTYPSSIHNTLSVHPVSGLFYTISRGNTNLVSIDPQTGVAQTVGKTNVADITALAFNAAGRLFAATGSDDNLSSLYELNPDTGALIALIGDTETQGIKGIDFDPISGELFGFASEGELDFGNTLAADSSSELIGNTGLGDIAAIAFNDADHLYATSGTARSPSTLYRLDPQTGSVIATIGNTGLFGVVGIDFQPGTETLYAFANGPSSIYLAPTLTAASDGTIFTIQSRNDDYLVTVDPNSPWTVTYQGEFALNYSASLAMSADDRLYAVSENLTDYRLDYELVELDPTDGSILQSIGSTGYRDVRGLAFDPVTGDLYAHASASRNFNLENNLASDLNGMFYSIGYLDDETALIQILNSTRKCNSTSW